MRAHLTVIVAVLSCLGRTEVFSANDRHITEAVRILEPSIVAFAPSSLPREKDEGSIEAAAHLRFAIEDTYKCLLPKRPVFRLIYAERLSLRNGSHSEDIDLMNLGQAIGAILVEPGRKARAIFSTEGPSTLQYLIPQAASEYWLVGACSQ